MRTLLVTVLVSLSGVAVHTRAAPGEHPGGRVELEVAGVMAVGDDEGGTLLILRQKGARTILPMLIPGDAGRALASELESKRTPALMGVTLQALGARVQEVELQGSEDEVQAGRARVAQGRKVVEVAGPPPELVALAVATKAPIFIDRRLLESAGLTAQQLDRARRRMAAKDRSMWM